MTMQNLHYRASSTHHDISSDDIPCSSCSSSGNSNGTAVASLSSTAPLPDGGGGLAATRMRKRREMKQSHLHPHSGDMSQQRVVFIGGRRVMVGTSLAEKVVLSLAALGWAGVVVLLLVRYDLHDGGGGGYYADEPVSRRYHSQGQHGPHHGGGVSDEGPRGRGWNSPGNDPYEKDDGTMTFLSRINPFYLDVHDHSGLGGDPASRTGADDGRYPYLHHPHSREQGRSGEPNAHYNRPRRGGGFRPGGNRPETIVESPNNPEYLQLRQEFDSMYPESPSAMNRRLNLIDSTLRKREYKSIEPDLFNNDPVRDCPLYPPEGYPVDYPTVDILNNWNPDNPHPPSNLKIYQGLCVFDYQKDYQKALNYRRAEVPFIVRGDPEVARTVERWNHPDYLKRLLKQNNNIAHRAEYSQNNHFMYWMLPNNRRRRGKFNRRAPEGWTKPTELIRMTYEEWLAKANVTDEELLQPNKEHWYFRLIGCGATENCDIISSDMLFEELPFFQPKENLYMVEPEQQRGIHCRFGMQGVVAENHFDGSRNSIALLGGERRYILSHPAQCDNLALYPMQHPSGRHSEVDWTNPDLDAFPQFAHARSNEVVLQAGDVLYLPTNWFHFIVSLNLNFQCNSRSGISNEYMGYTKACGF